MPSAPAIRRRWTRLGPALGAAATLLLAGCGDNSSQAAWVGGHPDTALLGFSSTAPGICAITVQYQNDAPAAIQYLGSLYVQVAREPRSSPAPGQPLDKTGDWVIRKLDNGDLLLVAPVYAYRYRAESNC